MPAAKQGTLLASSKLTSECMQCFMYCLLFSSGALALRGKAWVWDTRQYWEGWPQHAPS